MISCFVNMYFDYYVENMPYYIKKVLYDLK